jgi:hypothetical protein
LALILNAIYRELLTTSLPGHRPAGGKAMIEAVTAIYLLFSISVFLAHAFRRVPHALTDLASSLLPKITNSPQNSSDRLESF